MKKTEILNYTVKIYPSEEGGFWAKVPALPGCHTEGKTLEEVVAMAHEAIECHVGSLLQHNEHVPVERKKFKKMQSFSIPISISIPQMV